MVWKFKLQLIRDRDETHLELALVAGGSGAATTLGAAEAEETRHETLGFLGGSDLGDLIQNRYQKWKNYRRQILMLQKHIFIKFD